MRPAAVTLIMLVATVEVTAQFAVPRGQVYRGPFYLTRPAVFVRPDRTIPLDFQNGTFTLGMRPPTLSAGVRSQTLLTVPLSGITLRVALGPTATGMITFRMRPRVPETPATPLVRLTPNSHLDSLPFDLAQEDPPPGPLVLTPQARVLFTLERVETSEGTPLFENPDATELLWEALGRPSFSHH